MDTSNAEFGLASVIKAPGYVAKTGIVDKVIEADERGLVRKMASPVPSMFLRPQAAIHFEVFFAGRLCMIRGIISKEMSVNDSDTGYVRDHHVWLIFSPKTARHIAIDLNPTPLRENIWLRPKFAWDHSSSIEVKDGDIKEPSATIMDALSYTVGAITTEDHLSFLTCEASRLRSIFVASILEGATKIPDVQLPTSKQGLWTRSTIVRCWAQARKIVDPMIDLRPSCEERHEQ